MLKSKLIVAISMITYNHEKYISYAIEGVLKQKTDFKVKLFLTDDCSTDKTGYICQEYANKFPEVIDLEIFESNIGSKANIQYNLSKCEKSDAQYIAICEGDDFWTDPFKLQKQFNFFNKNEEYVLSYHDTNIIDENNEKIKEFRLPNTSKKDYSKEELISGADIVSHSVMFRNVELLKYIGEDGIENNDILLWSKLAHYGKAKYLDNITDISYRLHPGGWTSKPILDKFWSSLEAHLVIYRNNSTQDIYILEKKIYIQIYNHLIRFISQGEFLKTYSVLIGVHKIREISLLKVFVNFIYNSINKLKTN